MAKLVKAMAVPVSRLSLAEKKVGRMLMDSRNFKKSLALPRSMAVKVR